MSNLNRLKTIEISEEMFREYQRIVTWSASEHAKLEQELTALRAWKEHRLKDADPKVEHLVDTLSKRVEALEAWKEKARPFLEEEHKIIKSVLLAYPNDLKYPEKFKTLTELLGGNDE